MRNRQTCGIRLQVVPQKRGPNLQDLHCRHVTLPHLQDGVVNSEKAYRQGGQPKFKLYQNYLIFTSFESPY